MGGSRRDCNWKVCWQGSVVGGDSGGTFCWTGRDRTFAKDDLVIVLYRAFEHCVGQLFESNWLRGYNDAPVKNKYIYSTRTRKQLLEELIELDKRFARTESIRDWADGFNEAKGVFAYVREVLLGKVPGRLREGKLQR